MSPLGDRTWTELRDAPVRTVLVPLGSTEQHGPHLPLDTDTRIAVAWAGALAAVLPDSVVAPALPFGSSGEHEGFPGTISIGQDALQLVLVELVRSLSHWAEAVVLVCGHGGNWEPVQRATGALRDEGRRVRSLFPRLPGDAHAGRTETSLLLHLCPELVRLDRAEAGCLDPLELVLDRLRLHGVLDVAPNGVLGDPAGASAAEGRHLLDRLTRQVD